MSTPIPGWSDPDRENVAADPLTPVTSPPPPSIEPPAPVDGPVEEFVTGQADVIVVPTPVPVPVEVPVPVPVEPGQPWTGTVIEAVPTTADEIAALVLSVPDVVRLHAGRFGEVATYLPGRRVTGVKLSDELIEVHVVIAGQTPVQQTAQAIHAAVATLIATPVHVFIEDIAAA